MLLCSCSIRSRAAVRAVEAIDFGPPPNALHQHHPQLFPQATRLRTNPNNRGVSPMRKRRSVAQPASVPNPSATTPPAAPNLERHSRKCAICHHPDRALIEDPNRDKLAAQPSSRRGGGQLASRLHVNRPARSSESNLQPQTSTIQKPLIATPPKLKSPVTPTKQRTAPRPNRHNPTPSKSVLLHSPATRTRTVHVGEGRVSPPLRQTPSIAPREENHKRTGILLDNDARNLWRLIA